MAVPCEIKAGQITVRGISLAGVFTCFQVPQFNLLFDVGHCPRSLAATSRLFLTHGHADHSGGVIGLLSLRLLLGIKTPLSIFAPAYLVDGLTNAIRAYESFQHYPYRWELTAVGPGDEIPVGQRQFIRTFPSVHVIETQGYTVWERVEKLKPEFKGLPGPEIGRRKHQGDDLFDTVERPLLSFPGDTTIETLEQQPHLFQSRVLLLETTYIDDRKSPQECIDHGHVHLDHVLERADRFQNEHLVFTHFSQAYRPPEVHEIITQRCAGLFTPKVHAFAPTTGSWPG